MKSAKRQLNIRVAKPEDIEEILEMRKALANHHHNIDPGYYATPEKAEALFRKYLERALSPENENSIVWIAEVDSEAAGFYSLDIKIPMPSRVQVKTAYMRDGYIKPEFRRMGISKDLFDTVFKWFKQEGVKTAELSVDSRNTIALEAWKNAGFEEYRKKMKKNF